MNFTKATRLLNLPLNGPTFTETDIRKAYLKSSLKYHPDKYGDDGTAFKELHEAYVFMCERRKMQPDKIENSFDNILKEFISKFSQKKNWNNVFIQTTIKGIFMKCENYIINIFENLEKDIAIEVFDFLTQINNQIIFSPRTINNLIRRNINLLIDKILKDRNKSSNTNARR